MDHSQFLFKVSVFHRDPGPQPHVRALGPLPAGQYLRKVLGDLGGLPDDHRGHRQGRFLGLLRYRRLCIVKLKHLFPISQSVHYRVHGSHTYSSTRHMKREKRAPL